MGGLFYGLLFVLKNLKTELELPEGKASGSRWVDQSLLLTPSKYFGVYSKANMLLWTKRGDGGSVTRYRRFFKPFNPRKLVERVGGKVRKEFPKYRWGGVGLYHWRD